MTYIVICVQNEEKLVFIRLASEQFLAVEGRLLEICSSLTTTDLLNYWESKK